MQVRRTSLAAPFAGGGQAPDWRLRLAGAAGLLLVAVAAVAAGPAAADTAAGANEAQASAAVQPAAAPVNGHELTVQRAQLVAEGSMLELHFTVTGTRRLPVEPSVTYVIDENSGEHLEVANLTRVGPLAQRRKSADGASFMVFDNRFGHITHGGSISVVVGGLKQEHVVVE